MYLRILPMVNLFKSICDRIIDANSGVRFAAIVDEHGTILATSERKGLKPLLDREQTAQYALAAVTRQYTRIRWQSILGKIDYTCSYYEKVLRVTLPITDSNNRLRAVVIFTFDVSVKDFHSIIMKKLIPIVRNSEPKLIKKLDNTGKGQASRGKNRF
jgi:hypothetical protein